MNKRFLFLQLTPPLAAILALLCIGIFTGATHRERVLDFEQNYLGLPLSTELGEIPTVLANSDLAPNTADLPSFPMRVPASGNPSPANQPQHAAIPSQQQPSTQIPLAQNPVVNQNPVFQAPATAPALMETPPANTVPAPTVDQNVGNAPGQTQPVALPTPQPPAPQPGLSQNLANSLELPITVQVKVLVDSEYVAADPNWAARMQQTISEVSRIYQDNFGIRISLVGIVRWPVATRGLDGRQLMTDLSQRPREGADVLLGFVNRTLNSDTYKSNMAQTNQYNGSFGLVGRTDAGELLFLMGMLRGLGHMLGAIEVTDPSTEGYRLGTWMSNMAGRNQTLWIDADNRRRIFENKTKPFAP